MGFGYSRPANIVPDNLLAFNIHNSHPQSQNIIFLQIILIIGDVALQTWRVTFGIVATRFIGSKETKVTRYYRIGFQILSDQCNLF